MNKTLLFTKIIYSLFLICTIITCAIVYSNVDNSIATKFVMGYAVFALFMLLYIPILTLFNARKLKWNYLNRVLNEFIFLFAIMFVLNCTFDYIFKNSNIDILHAGSNALGLSFGLAFVNVTFLKKEKNYL
jgi:hypothetical protein